MRLQVVVVVLSCALQAERALGQAGSIQDQAVTLAYPAAHWSAMADADLLGAYASPTTDPLRASGYWYRIVGVDGREHPLPAPDSVSYQAGGLLVADWNDLDGKGLRVQEVTYVHDNERPSGTFTSRLKLTNVSSGPLEVEVFHYVDLDVPGGDADDTVSALSWAYLGFGQPLTGGPSIRYRGYEVQRFQVAAYPALRDALNDASATQLTNAGVPFGPGNASAACSWRTSVPPGGVSVVGKVSVSVRAQGNYVKGERLAHDGYPALIFRRVSDGHYLFWDMRRSDRLGVSSFGSGAFQGRLVGADDFDGKYDTDFVSYDSATGLVYVDNEQVAGALPVPQPWLWNVEATGDFDDDGKPDIVWRNSSTRKIVIWRMDDNAKLGDLVPVPDQASDANWAIKAALDFDRDGRRDLLWYNSTSGKAVIWYMDAAVHRISGTFTDPSSAGNSNWKIVAAGDYGKGPVVPGAPLPAFGVPDIVWRNDTSGRLVIWHMNTMGQRTAGVFTTPDVPDAGNPLDYEVVGPR